MLTLAQRGEAGNRRESLSLALINFVGGLARAGCPGDRVSEALGVGLWMARS